MDLEPVPRTLDLIAWLVLFKKILKQTGIEENLISIVPSTRRLDNKNNEQFVDIKLEGLGLKEAVSFLERLHKINQIHITRLNIVRKKW